MNASTSLALRRHAGFGSRPARYVARSCLADCAGRNLHHSRLRVRVADKSISRHCPVDQRFPDPHRNGVPGLALRDRWLRLDCRDGGYLVGGGYRGSPKRAEDC